MRDFFPIILIFLIILIGGLIAFQLREKNEFTTPTTRVEEVEQSNYKTRMVEEMKQAETQMAYMPPNPTHFDMEAEGYAGTASVQFHSVDPIMEHIDTVKNQSLDSTIEANHKDWAERSGRYAKTSVVLDDIEDDIRLERRHGWGLSTFGQKGKYDDTMYHNSSINHVAGTTAI